MVAPADRVNLTMLASLRYEPLLEASNVTTSNSKLLPLGSGPALRALQNGEVDAAVVVGATRSPIIWQALHDESLKLMSFADADAYQ